MESPSHRSRRASHRFCLSPSTTHGGIDRVRSRLIRLDDLADSCHARVWRASASSIRMTIGSLAIDAPILICQAETDGDWPESNFRAEPIKRLERETGFEPACR